MDETSVDTTQKDWKAQLEDELRELTEANLRRGLRTVEGMQGPTMRHGGKTLINLSSNKLSGPRQLFRHHRGVRRGGKGLGRERGRLPAYLGPHGRPRGVGARIGPPSSEKKLRSFSVRGFWRTWD